MNVIHFFNPGHENAVLNRAPSYTPPASMQRMMSELSSIPLWYSDKNHFVLVDNIYDKSYFDFLIDTGFHIPKIIYYKELVSFNKSKINLWGSVLGLLDTSKE